MSSLPEDHPLWLVDTQINGILDGEGSSDDHANVRRFLVSTGLPNDTAVRVHTALVAFFVTKKEEKHE